jgi:hypothetical protein
MKALSRRALRKSNKKTKMKSIGLLNCIIGMLGLRTDFEESSKKIILVFLNYNSYLKKFNRLSRGVLGFWGPQNPKTPY